MNNIQISNLPPMLYRLYSVQQKIRWCNYAISKTHTNDTALLQYRKNKRDELRKEEIEIMLQIAEKNHLIKLLVQNQIEFIIINEKIHIL